MKIYLMKKIHLIAEDAYLKIERSEQDLDIQNYLLGNKSYPEQIENRLDSYLQNIGIYNQYNSLTDYGEKVKETGEITKTEEGKYRIYRTKDDKHWRNTIFYFERERVEIDFNKEVDFRTRSLNEYNLLLSTDINDYEKFRLKGCEKIVTDFRNSNYVLGFTWFSDDNLQTSHYKFEGKLSHNINSENIPADKNIANYIVDILPEWNKKTQRCKVYFKDLDNEALETFQFKNKTTPDYGDFKVEIKNLDLEPYNKEEAQKWRNALLDKEIKKDYINKDDFTALVHQINEKTAFANFDLNIPTVEEYIKNKKSNSKEYWHLKAPMDLNSNTLLFPPVYTTTINDRISYRMIVDKFIDYTQSYKQVVYYDRFVIYKHQQKKALALLGSIEADNKVIITDKQKSVGNFKDSGDIIVKPLPTPSKNKDSNKVPHDRYLMIQDTNNQWIVFSITASLDYMRFEEGIDITSDAKGIVRDAVTFTKIDFNDLPQLIKELI